MFLLIIWIRNSTFWHRIVLLARIGELAANDDPRVVIQGMLLAIDLKGSDEASMRKQFNANRNFESLFGK